MVQRIWSNSAYNSSTQNNDIALLQLEKPISPSSSGFAPQAVSLATTSDVDYYAGGQMATVTGWGNTSSTSAVYPTDLMQVSVPIIDNPSCSAYDKGLTDKDSIRVEMLAPGLDPGSIDVSVLRDQLRVSGVKSPLTKEIKPEAFHRSERGSGSFTRVIALPAEVDGDKVKAEYKNGLLLLTLPKHEQAKPRQITVSVD